MLLLYKTGYPKDLWFKGQLVAAFVQEGLCLPIALCMPGISKKTIVNEMKILNQLIAAIFAGLHSSGRANWQTITEDKPVMTVPQPPIRELNKREELNKWEQPAKCQN